MSGETQITICGNLTSDPETRQLQGGVSVTSFTVASTPRTYNKQTNEFEDGEATFWRCSAWREQGENAANSLSKGARVIVQGTVQQRTY